MKIVVTFLGCILAVIQLSGQCDSAEVRRWISSINYDTVSTTRAVIKKDHPMILFGADSGTFTFYYVDTYHHASTIKTYEDYWLTKDEHCTDDTCITKYFFDRTCKVRSELVEIENDSLSGPEEGEQYYDFYSEINYNIQGRKIDSYTIVHVVKDGKKYKKITDKKYWFGIRVNKKVTLIPQKK